MFLPPRPPVSSLPLVLQDQNQQTPPTNDWYKLEETKSNIAVHVLIYHFTGNIHNLEQATPKKTIKEQKPKQLNNIMHHLIFFGLKNHLNFKLHWYISRSNSDCRKYLMRSFLSEDYM